MSTKNASEGFKSLKDPMYDLQSEGNQLGEKPRLYGYFAEMVNYTAAVTNFDEWDQNVF